MFKSGFHYSGKAQHCSSSNPQHIPAETEARNAKENNPPRTTSKDDKIKGQKTVKMEFTKRNGKQGEGRVRSENCSEAEELQLLVKK